MVVYMKKSYSKQSTSYVETGHKLYADLEVAKAEIRRYITDILSCTEKAGVPSDASEKENINDTLLYKAEVYFISKLDGSKIEERFTITKETVY